MGLAAGIHFSNSIGHGASFGRRDPHRSGCLIQLEAPHFGDRRFKLVTRLVPVPERRPRQKRGRSRTRRLIAVDEAEAVLVDITR
jgi:hypothetical protein